MKKRLFFSLLACVGLSHVEIPQGAKDYLKQNNIKYLDGQLEIVSANSFTNDKESKDRIATYFKMNQEQRKKGYIHTDAEPRAKELMNLHHHAAIAIEHSNQKSGFEHTGLRANPDELLMAYTYLGVPADEIKALSGIAPFGAYKSKKNGDDATGWDGAVAYFESQTAGSCAFWEHNYVLAHAGVELIKEFVTHEINDRPTVVLTKGNKKDGFVYNVSWYDDHFSRQLECASSRYSNDIKQNIIELAKKIDVYNHQTK